MKIPSFLIVYRTLIVACFFYSGSGPAPARAQQTKKILDLNGKWKFTIVDRTEWALPQYDDSKWEEIRVPSTWESQGYYGYNGYAWYRKTVQIPGTFENKSLFIDLGYIDDVDEVYFNGELIGYSGSFPPHFQTAYTARRIYHIPASLIRSDKGNVIAVRIFDAQGEGGIVNGDICLREEVNPVPLDIDLQGVWKFRTGDDPAWNNPTPDASGWFDIIVPGNWENQGYNDYNGFAWYFKTFRIDEDLKGRSLLLLLGKIDDINEVYVNGILTGTTGNISNDPRKIRYSDEWLRLRVYALPDNILKYQSVNIIAVRVYDGGQGGGIYQGPVGIITKEKYVEYRQKNR